jgi:hypothetical protein
MGYGVLAWLVVLERAERLQARNSSCSARAAVAERPGNAQKVPLFHLKGGVPCGRLRHEVRQADPVGWPAIESRYGARLEIEAETIAA